MVAILCVIFVLIDVSGEIDMMLTNYYRTKTSNL